MIFTLLLEERLINENAHSKMLPFFDIFLYYFYEKIFVSCEPHLMLLLF